MINSQAKQQALSSKIRDSQRTWIGLYRNPKEKSRWLWVDGSRLTYTYWSSGEPNNAGGSEDCAEIYPRNSEWNDKRCATLRHYVCEANGRSENILNCDTSCILNFVC